MLINHRWRRLHGLFPSRRRHSGRCHHDNNHRPDGRGTPFISKLTLAVSDTTVLKSIQFTITPKPGSVTRPLSGTYFNNYLLDRGFENPTTGAILLPVYGLYDGYANTVRLTYSFLDGSSKQANTIITTAPANPSESATLQTLAPGAYTAIEAAADGSRV
jgi:arylsulfotransferase ASST